MRVNYHLSLQEKNLGYKNFVPEILTLTFKPWSWCPMAHQRKSAVLTKFWQTKQKRNNPGIPGTHDLTSIGSRISPVLPRNLQGPEKDLKIFEPLSSRDYHFYIILSLLYPLCNKFLVILKIYQGSKDPPGPSWTFK